MRRVLIPLLSVVTLVALGVAPAQAVETPAPTPSNTPTAATTETSSTQKVVTTEPGNPIAPPPVLSNSAVASATNFAATSLDSTVADTGNRTADVISVGDGTAVKLQQTVAGVPVLGGQTIVALDSDNRIVSAVSEGISAAPTSTGATVSRAAAQATAISSVATAAKTQAGQLLASPPSLWVYDPKILDAPGGAKPTSVWRTEVTSSVDLGIRYLVLVNASTGAIALSVSEINAAITQRVCDFRNSREADPSCPSGSPLTVANASSSSERNAVSATRFANDTADFYSQVLGRTQLIPGAGTAQNPLASSVRYCTTDSRASCPFDNAFWNGTQMVYGDGFASAQDVVAHELTHGVTQSESGLFYYHQSGAINESLSDIFGEFVDQWSHDTATGVTDIDTAAKRWQMGEDLPNNYGPVRFMSNPLLDSNPAPLPAHDADRVSSPYFYTGESDAGGVHENSGVGNHFAALLTDGGTFNGVTVSGIGLTKTAQVIYSASRMLTSAADYRAFAASLKSACSLLAFSAADCAQVSNAIGAVDMEVRPSLAQIAPLCLAGQTKEVLWSDNMHDGPGDATNFSPQAIQGTPEWYYATDATPISYGIGPYATSGTNNLWGNDGVSRADFAMQTNVDIASLPALAAGESYAFGFNHAYGFEVLNGATIDGGVVEISTNSGATWVDAGARFSAAGGYRPYTGTISGSTANNPLAGRLAFVGHSAGYTASRADLSDLAGKSIRLRFRIGQTTKAAGDSGDYGWFIDDVALVKCSGPAGLVSAPSFVRAVAGSGSADVRWSAVPGAESYLVTSMPEGRTCTTSGVRCSIFGLTNGKAYTFVVQARGKGLTSQMSTASIRVIPSAVPTLVPSLGKSYASRTSRNIVATWAAASANGSAIVRYQYCLSAPTATSCASWYSTGLRRSVVFSGWAKGRTAKLWVRAVNARGAGAPRVTTITQNR